MESRSTLTITEPEAAEQVGVGYKAFVALRRHGQGPPYVRVGRYIRYRPQDIEAWLEDQVTPQRRGGR